MGVILERSQLVYPRDAIEVGEGYFKAPDTQITDDLIVAVYGKDAASVHTHQPLELGWHRYGDVRQPPVENEGDFSLQLQLRGARLSQNKAMLVYVTYADWDTKLFSDVQVLPSLKRDNQGKLYSVGRVRDWTDRIALNTGIVFTCADAKDLARLRFSIWEGS
jgi:hypothetical protein